ncbi:MAG: ABC-F family ATP-binding cassette domain-containing protein [Clostridia bacterium]|nr:ABC-F family ATP-binding cassette domain-containing protein [Clostridia bacterium]
MAIVSLSNVSKTFVDKKILENIDLTIDLNEKIGIVGVNGCGKSTLLKIINGDIYPDKGNVNKANKYKISYLPQRSELDSDNTLFNEMLEIFNYFIDMEKSIRELELKISKDPNNTQLLKRYAELQEEFDSSGGYAYQSQIKGVLNGLGFNDEDYSKKISSLSGGQKSRVSLAKILLEKPDLLLLDEPTNHLDIEATEWLESFLSGYKGSIIIISHDRYFLDSLVDTIYQIENAKITKYKGNYTEYLNQKEILDQQRIKQYKENQLELKRQERIIQRYRSINTQRSIKAARSREKAVEKMDIMDKPVILQEKMRFSIPVKKQSGKKILSIKGLSKSFGELELFNSVNLDIYRGERIGFIGKNGTGKTTLFNIILGKYPPSSGEYTIGHNVEIGYYDQEQKTLDATKTIIDNIWDCYPHMKETDIRNMLAAFLFKEDDVFKTVSTLSGGERARVALLKTVLSGANLFLLDEPTNHLDIQSKEVLEQALIEYKGTMIVISHDRYFLDKIATRILELEDGKIKDYNGNYTYYRRKKNELLSTSIDNSPPPKPVTDKKQSIKQCDIKSQKLEKIEEKIQQRENQIKEFEHKMCDPSYYSDPDKSKEINIKYNNYKAELNNLYTQWEELIS